MTNNEKNKIVFVPTKTTSLHCPLPEQEVWSKHPKVYLIMNDQGEVRCPYCSTVYKTKSE